MAGGGDDIVDKFQKFCSLAGAKGTCQMTSKASGKLVADCFEEGYKKFDVKSIVDASVFPAVKEKGKPHMVLNKANCDKYISKTAHEIAKRKTGNTKIATDDQEVVTIRADLCSRLSGGGPKVKVVKTSKTGGVGNLTDTSHYTGSHKERFDDSGKGKGLVGRKDIVDDSGYVGNYKNQGTFDQKK